MGTLFQKIVNNKDVVIKVGSSLIGAFLGAFVASLITVEKYDVTTDVDEVEVQIENA